MQALPEFFIVKVSKEEQKKKKEKIGSLYLHQSHIEGERGMQCGEIVFIGAEAKKQLPEAGIGDTLIFHWMIEFNEKDEVSKNFIKEDDEFNYYIVASKECNGRRNETYGVFKNDTIIPNGEYIFLQEKKEETVYDEMTTTSTGGIIVFKNWNETRESKQQKAASLKTEIESLAKTKITDDYKGDQLKRAIEAKEQESAAITATLTKKKYEQFKVFYANPKSEIKNGDTIFCLSIAASTTVNFQNQEYIVANQKYVAAIL